VKNDDFDLLVASIKEAGDIKSGNTQPSRFCEMNAPDIKAIRHSLQMSQGKFALMIGVSVRPLQHWEQGRREPAGPAKALLRVASMNPRAVIEALHVD